jgi:membrane-associated protein
MNLENNTCYNKYEMFLDVNQIIQTGGLLAVLIIIFAETGLLLGFFLPGDTLLIAAGIFASQNRLPLIPLLVLTPIAAILGYQVAYKIGEEAGPRLFHRDDGVLFRTEYVTRTENFIKNHGGKAILLARFIVVVRTIIPLVAGMGKMNKKKFLFFNVTGSILWTTSVILAASWLGHRIPNLDKYLILLVVGAMLITTGGGLLEVMRTKSRRAALKRALKDELHYFFKRDKK